MQVGGLAVLGRRIQAVQATIWIVHNIQLAVRSTLMYGHDGQQMEKNGTQARWLARQHSNGIARDCMEEGSI